MGGSVESLEALVETIEGDAESLSVSEGYARLTDLAPAPLHLVLYLDLAEIVRMVEEGLGRDAFEYYDEDVRPFVENLDALVVAGSLVEGSWRGWVALALEE